MNDTFLVITSVAEPDNPILISLAEEAARHNIPFILIGDTKSPKDFKLAGCDFYSIERQKSLDWAIARELPVKQYSRKNIGYLVAIAKGAEIIIETDDDNIPMSSFWEKRKKEVCAHLLKDQSWVNVYKYFTKKHIWPRGFALDQIFNKIPPPTDNKIKTTCCIQQGLVDENPDVDAIYRLILPLPIEFNRHENIAIGINTWCPFNSQNTTWFKEAFPLLYLPSYCSFRITDIWRSFIAQRIAWTCEWNILFHKSTVWQKRHEHNLMNDFVDEISGYINNKNICSALQKLELKKGVEYIPENLIECYKLLINMNLLDKAEMNLVELWLKVLTT